MFLLPSLNRPASLSRFFAHYRRTGATLGGLVLLNGEDYLANQNLYEALRAELPAGWGYFNCRSNTLGGKLNEAWGHIHDTYEWLGYLQDDLVPVTPGWDTQVGALVASGKHWVTVEDGFRPGRTTGAWAMSAPLLRATGWVFPPQLPHLFADDAWENIGANVPGLRHHAADILLEHRHAMVTRNFDSTTKSIYAQDKWDQARPAYASWCKLQLPAVVARIEKMLVPQR